METNFDEMMKAVYGENWEPISGVKDALRDFSQLMEHFKDVKRKMAYIVEQYDAIVKRKDCATGDLHDLGYLLERRDSYVLFLLSQLEESLCLGRGHRLTRWPSFEEMLNEQNKKLHQDDKISV